jgi:dihydropteroate synthase type 2/dihydropteroate synthase type 3
MSGFKNPQIVGVVNITGDSFSDGGKFLNTEAAIAQAEKLHEDGADIIDLGAAASNPHANHVDPEEEIRRLEPVVAHLKEKRARISIDTTKIDVQKWAIKQEVEFLNDIRGFPDTDLYADLAASTCKLIVMHFISDLDKAVRKPKTVEEVFDSINSFFASRLPLLRDAGISSDRIIIDPGMGFFLASNPEPSLAVLARFPEFKKRFELPIMLGVSRKSFLKNLPARTTGVRSDGGPPEGVDIQTRTLAAELFAAERGADYIRTHEITALREGLHTLEAIMREE